MTLEPSLSIVTLEGQEKDIKQKHYIGNVMGIASHIQHQQVVCMFKYPLKMEVEYEYIN